MNCEVYVRRRYSRAGPCQSTRGLQRVKVRDVRVTACMEHAAQLAGGRPLELVLPAKRLRRAVDSSGAARYTTTAARLK